MTRLATVLLLGTLGACTTTGGLFSGVGRAGAPAQSGRGDEFDGEALAVYLQVMEALLEDDPVRQAETFQAVDADAASAPNTTNRLKLALALSIPGHAGSNAEHAQQELRELLAASEVLLPGERVLAALQLAEVEQRLLLDLEAQQTQSAAEASIERQATDTEQRLRQLQEENRVLRSELEEAQNVIDEITNIERSIRERESAD